MKKLYADIIIDISHESVDRTFQYRIPERLAGEIQPGCEVRVPFGRGNRLRSGYVIEVTDRALFDESKTKELAGLVRDGIPIEGQMIRLASWLHKNYGGTMIQALRTVLPVKDKMQELTKRTVEAAIPPNQLREWLGEYKRKNCKAKVRLVEALLERQILPMQTVKQELRITASTLDALVREGVIRLQASAVRRNPVQNLVRGEEYCLTKLQNDIVERIHAQFDNREKKPFLLHGITGSGKTEVYVELVARAAGLGKPSIVLIPEIALTRQTVLRFYKRFGDRVSVIHSRLSKGERYDQFERAKAGEIDVIIGPRSALFTPFAELGYIIVDEEHETSYKSENVPKFHARDVAVERGRMTGATVVLASATPSVDSYYMAQNGFYQLVEMKERISGRTPAAVSIVDLRDELRLGNRSIFSALLRGKMEECLKKGRQSLLFLNRRGYHGFLSCRACGEAVKCPNCDVTLSLHRNGQMICHYCGFTQPKVTRCPACASPYIGGFRVGTEQVEELVHKSFPGARVLRMDMDTTRGKHGHEQIVEAFANQEADILIGTQMIVKGHDFPNVTLVGILAADMSLQTGDFRSAERTFQLLTQAAGRAGRGDLAGEVVIQTYQPEHYSIQMAARQSYEEFYEAEMQFRRTMKYPPAGNVLEIFLSSEDERLVREEAQKLAELLGKIIKEQIPDSCTGIIENAGRHIQAVMLLGPAPADIARLNSRYRQVLYLKADRQSELLQIMDLIEHNYECPADLQLQFDKCM